MYDKLNREEKKFKLTKTIVKLNSRLSECSNEKLYLLFQKEVKVAIYHQYIKLSKISENWYASAICS